MKQQFFIGLFLCLSVLAHSANSVGEEGKELKREIERTINYPEFAKKSKLQGIVLVHYRVDSEGHIIVEEINASDDRLANYVKTRLESIKIAERRAQGDHYAKFRFRYVDM